MRQSTAVNNQNANAFRFSKQVNKTSWAPLLLFLDTYVEQKRSNGHAEKSWHRAVCLATAFTPFHFYYNCSVCQTSWLEGWDIKYCNCGL